VSTELIAITFATVLAPVKVIHMEKAIFISKVENLKYVTQEYSRLYFGIEFCQNLMPSKEELGRILKFVSENKIDFTFVTPYLTNEGMRKIKPLLSWMINGQPKAEIVINDWGLLRWICREYFDLDLVLGRLLTKQKRGPRILNLMGRVPDTVIRHFRQSNIDSLILSNFLISKQIKRVELDNLLQGISRPPHSLKASLYIPFAYITTTRLCLLSACEDKVSKPLRAISGCNRECQRYTFKLQHKHMPTDLFLKGNTQFFRNECIPDNLNDFNIDRIVYEPEIPL
jgi:hypothetical protein